MIDRRNFICSAVAAAVSAALPPLKPISFRGVPIVWDYQPYNNTWKSRTDPVYFLTDEFIFNIYGGTVKFTKLCDPNNWDTQ